MDLSGIISVAGMGGLHKVVAQIKNGLVVEALADEKRVYVSDIKKVLNWYNLLHKEGLLEKKEQKTEDDKPVLKVPSAAPAVTKTNLKYTMAKPVKTARSNVKTQGVRKTGVA